MPNRTSKRREINALGHVIQIGNQVANTANKKSNEIKTHRRGRASGLSRWYSLPRRSIMSESATATIPNRDTRLITITVPVCESIALYLTA
jgi:hypothetical protein